MTHPTQKTASPLVRVRLRTLLIGAFVLGASFDERLARLAVMVARLLGL